MNIAAPVALLLVWASPAPLDGARRAFADGDYASAERLALDAAGELPESLYLVGLARFRAGRAADALDALDRSEAGADSPAAWRFNRGACLYELGRWAEAEAAFVEASRDPGFEPLALVNAGFAALDGGSPERARELAGRARAAAAEGPALALVEELEQALAPAPAQGPPAAAPEPPAAPAAVPAWSTRAHARAEAGWDSDAPRTGIGAVERPRRVVPVETAVESAFVAGGGGAEVRVPLGGASLEAGYALSQLAYVAPAVEDYSVQQHELRVAILAQPDPSFALEAALFGEYALAGVSHLRPMQAAAGVRLSAAYAWTDRQTTRALLSATAKDGRGAEFAALDGTRLEAAASHELTLASFLVEAGYRFQLERIGVVTTPLPVRFAPGSPMCPLGCTAADVEPLSYQGHTGWLGVRHEPLPWLRLDATAGVEGRWELHDLHTVLTSADGGELAIGRRRRSDVRGFGSEGLALRLAPGLFFTVRHEWLVNRTRVEAVSFVPPRALGTSSWDKHVLALGLTLDW